MRVSFFYVRLFGFVLFCFFCVVIMPDQSMAEIMLCRHSTGVVEVFPNCSWFDQFDTNAFYTMIEKLSAPDIRFNRIWFSCLILRMFSKYLCYFATPEVEIIIEFLSFFMLKNWYKSIFFLLNVSGICLRWISQITRQLVTSEIEHSSHFSQGEGRSKPRLL